jgi:hypothetical protein
LLTSARAFTGSAFESPHFVFYGAFARPPKILYLIFAFFVFPHVNLIQFPLAAAALKPSAWLKFSNPIIDSTMNTNMKCTSAFG